MCGYCFQTDDQKQSIIIDNKRIIFADKSAYTGFDDFYEKFKTVCDIIQKNKPIEKCSQLALKYVNQFYIDQDELNSEQPK
ncbi:MAG: TIGR04255 family protein [Endomicrobium sp.]|uniref:TIGR04255 family protein n=1 Tax=Candidatus Endomicrobiellum pyrsonymphae TaxID=1408203 RepID=UPI00358657DB|nr:TIGR04255 family protein [Endomicrobium sp.]